MTDNGWAPVPTENSSWGAVLCDIPKAVSSLYHHCTDINWTPELLFPQRTEALKGAVLCDTWGSELSIIALQEAESGVKQWALYHYIASLGDGTVDADGWLTMMVQWFQWFQTHCSESRARLKRVSSCPKFPLVAGRSNGRFFMVQQLWFLVSWTYFSMLSTITYLTR